MHAGPPLQEPSQQFMLPNLSDVSRAAAGRPPINVHTHEAGLQSGTIQAAPQAEAAARGSVSIAGAEDPHPDSDRRPGLQQQMQPEPGRRSRGVAWIDERPVSSERSRQQQHHSNRWDRGPDLEPFLAARRAESWAEQQCRQQHGGLRSSRNMMHGGMECLGLQGD